MPGFGGRAPRPPVPLALWALVLHCTRLRAPFLYVYPECYGLWPAGCGRGALVFSLILTSVCCIAHKIGRTALEFTGINRRILLQRLKRHRSQRRVQASALVMCSI